VNGTTICHFNGYELDLAKWETLTMREAIIKWWWDEAGPKPTLADFASASLYIPVVERLYAAAKTEQEQLRSDLDNRPPYSQDQERRSLAVHAAALHMELLQLGRDRDSALGRSVATVFEIVAEEHLIQPTIIYEFPLAVSPLSKQKPDEPAWVERFEFYIGGFELGNAFSELNDPEEQFRRFQEQLAQHERGDEEAHQMDVDYVRALAYGLPPTAGEGIGIDRLTMILTGARSIRDVILFPLLRPQAREPEAGSGKPEASQ
jgi:lysyl-tRNA synthetase class 2